MIPIASLSHAESRRAIDAHFGGRAVPELEVAMRAHALACAACRSYYDRHLILARLDPAARSPEDRIARGLGLGAAARGSTMGFFGWAALAVPVAAAILLVARPARVAPGPDADASPSTFVARSAVRAGAPEPRLWIYRVGTDGSPQLAHAEVRAGDELAFAYANPAGKRFVWVFGVDEHRHVYWFHPAWSRGRPAPSAVVAAPGPGPHELPDAIRYELDGRRLVVRALFADRALQPSDIEARVRSGAGWDGVQIVARELQVLP
jgi:hypothetical protein